VADERERRLERDAAGGGPEEQERLEIERARREGEELRTCPACERHVRASEARCPFCEAPLPPRPRGAERAPVDLSHEQPVVYGPPPHLLRPSGPLMIARLVIFLAIAGAIAAAFWYLLR
jgi:hypothetical protein